MLSPQSSPQSLMRVRKQRQTNAEKAFHATKQQLSDEYESEKVRIARCGPHIHRRLEDICTHKKAELLQLLLPTEIFTFDQLGQDHLRPGKVRQLLYPDGAFCIHIARESSVASISNVSEEKATNRQLSGELTILEHHKTFNLRTPVVTHSFFAPSINFPIAPTPHIARYLEMIGRRGQDCTRFHDRLRVAFGTTADMYEMVARCPAEEYCVVIAFADGFSCSGPALAAFCAKTRPFLLDIKLKEVHLRKHDLLSGSSGRRAWERSGIEMHPTDDGGIWIRVKSRELAVTVRER